MRHIVYISGTRADYGLMRHTLLAIEKNPNLKLSVVATGMHLMFEFGKTIKEIKKDGFKVHKVEATYKKDDKASMAEFIGRFSLKLTQLFKKIKPDIILLLGDRAEMLAGAVVGTYFGIPVAHIHGGDVSSTVDESARHAITKLANIHFPATKGSANRILKMGENEKYIYVVGAPGLDEINTKSFSKIYLKKKFGLDLTNPLLVVVQHPVSQEVKEAEMQMSKTMEAVKSLNLQTLVIYPNADAGWRRMIRTIEKYRKNPLVKIFKNINHKEFLSLMRYTSVMIGNSSSGIIEAPSFKLPAVNIGTRQEGRERSTNVIDVVYNKKEIKKAIRKALYDKNFREKVKKCKNPYGDGKAGIRIANILSKIKIDKKLLQKKDNLLKSMR